MFDGVVFSQTGWQFGDSSLPLLGLDSLKTANEPTAVLTQSYSTRNWGRSWCVWKMTVLLFVSAQHLEKHGKQHGIWTPSFRTKMRAWSEWIAHHGFQHSDRESRPKGWEEFQGSVLMSVCKLSPGDELRSWGCFRWKWWTLSCPPHRLCRSWGNGAGRTEETMENYEHSTWLAENVWEP